MRGLRFRGEGGFEDGSTLYDVVVVGVRNLGATLPSLPKWRGLSYLI